jgi:UPF0716 protein FxsA
MTIFQSLFLLFLLVPLGEIYILIQVGEWVGALPTLLLVVLTALVGASLVRMQGISTFMQVQANLAQGHMPAIALLEGVVILCAGALLLTPGFVTDAVGFACLVPPWRRRGINRLLQRHLSNMAERKDTSGRIIDGEYSRDEE